MPDTANISGQPNASSLFEFPDMANFLSVVSTAASQKAAAAKETALITQNEASNITDSAVAYNDKAQEALAQVSTIEAQGKTARAMADSGNIFDRISLIGDQMLNPQAYTRTGREARMGEISQDLAMRGQIHNIEVNASQARIAEAQANEAVSTADSSAALLKLTTQTDALLTINQGLVAAHTLKMNNLDTMDLPTLQKALVGPVPQDGKIRINGMPYTPLELRERSNALEMRDKLSFLSPQANDPDYAMKLRIQQGLQLQNMSSQELLTIRKNNYTMPDGTMADSATWEDAYNRNTRVQLGIVQQMADKAAIDNALPTLLTESQTMLKNGEKYITPGTPASAARTRFRASLESASAMSTQDGSEAGKTAQLVRVQGAQETYVKELEKEAKRQAGGDEKLTGIYVNRMLGLPPTEQQLTDFVVDRFKADKGFGDVLPAADAKLLQTNATQAYLKLKQEQAMDFAGQGPQLNDKDLKGEAIRQAMEKTAKDKAVDAINTIQLGLIMRPDHPAIAAGLIPGQLNGIIQQATLQANDAVAKRYGISADQIEAIRAGRPQDSGLSPADAKAAAGELNAEAMFMEYDLLDAKRPGLGYDVQQWTAKVLPDIARNYTANLEPEQQTLVGDAVLNEAQNYSGTYAAADESATQRGKKIATEMATGAKRPENMWPVLLTMDKNLTDSQKQTLYYDVLLPSMQRARQMQASTIDTTGMSADEAASAAVFSTLSTFKSEDKQTQAAVTIMNRELPKLLDNFGTMWDTMLWRTTHGDYLATQGGGEAAGITANRWRRTRRDPQLAADALKKVIPWMKPDAPISTLSAPVPPPTMNTARPGVIQPNLNQNSSLIDMMR